MPQVLLRAVAVVWGKLFGLQPQLWLQTPTKQEVITEVKKQTVSKNVTVYQLPRPETATVTDYEINK